MSRVEFDGVGTPIPTVALPPFGSDENLPQTVLTFTDSANFSVSDYRALGFTHFEALCVGAAGGRGGDASSQLYFAADHVRRPVPQDVWNLHLEAVRIAAYLFNGGVWDFVDHYGPAFPQGVTAVGYEEYVNPNHVMEFATVKQVLLRPSYEAFGGAGGGGGFHRASGVLADLPDVIPIVVGKAGVDALVGQTRAPGAWMPTITTPDKAAITNGYWEGGTPYGTVLPGLQGYWIDPPQAQRWADIQNYLNQYLNSYPPPLASFNPPQSGGNGGASIFADGVAQASGGQGGYPSKVYTGAPNSQTVSDGYDINGNGGDGGIGGQALVGGGGKGSTAAGVNGIDGTWHPQDGIGQGGGGGKGGSNTGYKGLTLATAGGQGSYSYADASVYGPRQMRSLYEYHKWWAKGRLKAPIEQTGDYIDQQSTQLPTSEILIDPYGNGLSHPADMYNNYSANPGPDLLMIPGGGGGARPLKNLKFGSRSPGYSPDGVIVVRLTRIT